MKTNKHQTLLFVDKKKNIRARDIVIAFDYSQGTARSYLSYLTRHGLLEITEVGHILTEKGQNRLRYFEAIGCGNLHCPLCKSKQAKHFTCPRCQYQLPKHEARIIPEWDFLLGIRHAGVYCPLCERLIFTEEQAKTLGIEEKS